MYNNAATYHPARPHCLTILKLPGQPCVPRFLPNPFSTRPAMLENSDNQHLDCTALCTLSSLLSLSILLYTTLKWYGSCVHYNMDHMILTVEVGRVDALCLVHAEVFYSLLTSTSTTMAAIPSHHDSTRW